MEISSVLTSVLFCSQVVKKRWGAKDKLCVLGFNLLMLLGLNAGLYGDVSLSAAGLDVMGFAAVGLGVIYLIGPLKLGASIASIPCLVQSHVRKCGRGGRGRLTGTRMPCGSFP